MRAMARSLKAGGLIQLTGRANYQAYGAAKGRNFVDGNNYLSLATDPQLAVDVSCWFWKKHGVNALADTDDIHAVTRKINGHLNGIENREVHLRRAKFVLV
jgi:putative chitinase